jgi:hypothetical protein
MSEPTAENAEKVPQEMLLRLQLQRERAARLQAEQRLARAEHDLADAHRQEALKEAATIEEQMAAEYGLKNGDGLKADGTIVREPRAEPPITPATEPKDNGKAEATPADPPAMPAMETAPKPAANAG